MGRRDAVRTRAPPRAPSRSSTSVNTTSPDVAPGRYLHRGQLVRGAQRGLPDLDPAMGPQHRHGPSRVADALFFDGDLYADQSLDCGGSTSIASSATPLGALGSLPAPTGVRRAHALVSRRLRRRLRTRDWAVVQHIGQWNTSDCLDRGVLPDEPATTVAPARSTSRRPTARACLRPPPHPCAHANPPPTPHPLRARWGLRGPDLPPRRRFRQGPRRLPAASGEAEAREGRPGHRAGGVLRGPPLGDPSALDLRGGPGRGLATGRAAHGALDLPHRAAQLPGRGRDGWHQDDQLYAEPQCSSSSASTTTRTPGGGIDAQGERFEWTPPRGAARPGRHHRGVRGSRRSARSAAILKMCGPSSEPCRSSIRTSTRCRGCGAGAAQPDARRAPTAVIGAVGPGLSILDGDTSAQ